MKNDNVYEQFMREPEEKQKKGESTQNMEDRINSLLDNKFNNATSKNDNVYEQFMKEPEEKQKKGESTQNIEDRLNSTLDNRFNNTTSRRYSSFDKGTSNGARARSGIMIFTEIRNLFVYTYNYFRYGYYGDI